MLCKTCHYTLAGLAEHRCPECGRAFDPSDSDSFLTARQAEEIEIDDRRWSITLLVMLAGIALAFVFFLILR